MKKAVLILTMFASAALFAAETAPQPEKAEKKQTAAVSAQAQPAAVKQTPAPAKTQQTAAPQKKEEPGIAFCMARGICNIATGWLEIPRCMIYDNGFMPVFGLIVGIPEGAFLTIGRTMCGVYDIVSFGTSGSTCHGEVFPDTIFQSKWQYKKN